VAALAALLLPSLAAAPIERAEIYFMDAARGMVETGDWLVPRYAGEPFFDKPILAYWLMAGAMSRFGTTPGAARLVAVAASFATVLATVWLGTLLFGRRTAVVGGLVLSTSVAFLAFSRLAMADMPLAAFTTAAVALGVRALQPDAPRWTLPALGIAAGLGFATKGPIAVVVPGLAAVALLWQKRREPLRVPPAAVAAAALSFAVLGLGWFALVYHRLGAGPIAYFFLSENLERFAGQTYDAGRPVWFYGSVYLAEGLPWSVFLPVALWHLLRDEKERKAGASFLALWVALVLVPLSLSRGKLDYYLLPVFPALSLLVARYFVAGPWRALDRAWARAAALLGAGALGVLFVWPPRLPADWLPGRTAQGVLALVMLASALALAGTALRPSTGRVLASLSASVAFAWLVLVVYFLPAFSAAQPNRAIARDVVRERRYRPDARVAMCSDPSRAGRDVLFEARVAVEEECALWGLAASRYPFLLLLTPEEHKALSGIPGYRQIATFRYVDARALTLEGLLSSPAVGQMVLAANFRTRDPIAIRKAKRERRRALRKAWGQPLVRPRR
jgi:4-amino-4-deoxy-L-arabinose transferase-like glycosyltransferase